MMKRKTQQQAKSCHLGSSVVRPLTPLQFWHKTPLLAGKNAEAKRAEIKQYFNQTFSCYEQLFDTLSQDRAYYLKAEPLRHPLIFYYGHTATFFINKLLLARLIDARINPDFESMFAVGVDEMSWDDLNDANYDWPPVDSVRAYRLSVRETVNHLIDQIPIRLPIQPSDPAWTLLMGIEHERIHLETSSVIIRMLPLECVRTLAQWPSCTETGPAPESNPFLPVAGQTVTLGKPDTDATYGWDNEYGRLTVKIQAFKASQFLVSNQAFLLFVEAAGYEKPELWTDEGQAWLAFSKAKHPRFWIKKQGQYWQRNLTQELPLPLNWPVEVNYLEAKAYCAWQNTLTTTKQRKKKHIRLPTEAEWCAMRNQIPTDQPTWAHAPGNINLEYFASSCPINWFAQQVGEETFYDLVGNVWQWTETPIDGYPGFEVHPLYDDFSTPTFDGKHNLIKGGSWISTGNEALAHSRYAFRRHFFQHAGFRVIETDTTTISGVSVNTYETDTLVAQYLEFHYGDSYFDVPNYPKACAELCRNLLAPNQRQRALDLGCAVGRASFELARFFSHVDGIDFSARFIQCGVQLQDPGYIRYTIPTEGDLVDYKEQSLSALGLSENAKSVVFSQGDAENLKPKFGDYDLVLASNLIDRLPHPQRFLTLIGERIHSGGYLVLTSPYTWLESFTEKTHWLGGFKKDGESVTTLATLRSLLGSTFEFVDKQELPFVIRETARKHQHTVSEASIWRKL